MKNGIVMDHDGLNDIMGRLICFNALLDALRLAVDEDNMIVDALASAHDLMSCICRDFQADIECAERCAERRQA